MSQAFHGGRMREARVRFQREAFVDFSANTNAFWSPPGLPGAAAAWEAASRYPEADPVLVAERLADLHDTPSSRILPTAGAVEALYLAARLFSDRSALLFHPCFADYARACLAASIETAQASLLPAPPDRLSAEQLIGSHDLVILGNPNNPTGRLFPRLADLVQSPALSHVAWIVDEAFIEFVTDHEKESLLPRIARLPNVIVLRALTKSWSIPGLRLGFIATSNEHWMRRLRTLQAPWPINGITESWALEHLTRVQQQKMLESLRPLAAARTAFAGAIASLPGMTPLPSDSNFLLVHTALRKVHEIEDACGHAGFLVRACRGFEGLDPERHFRIAVRSQDENQQLVDVLDRLCGVAPAILPSRGPRGMRSLSILGTSSNSGKSWVATAFCALLRRNGLNVAPFKAQNMSNNSAVTPDGKEIGRAQAVQAEACGLLPSVKMNPILLKPSGGGGSQLIHMGTARGHVKAADYYKQIESLWPGVEECLSHWRENCDVLVLEGAGSPVELNLLQRDLVNLRPVRHLGGKWLLVADIERGGVFAQAAGTWALLPPADRARCCGLIVNKFRGDLSLFSDAADYFKPHFGAPFLGTLPYASHLQPENEDSLSTADTPDNSGHPVHWIRFPHTSNSQDSHPWNLDEGVRTLWVERPEDIDGAKVVILPGSKNTLADLSWMHASGMAEAVLQANHRGALIIGICGGYQMLGRTLSDPSGLAGHAGEAAGLGLLPVDTRFEADKEVRTVEAVFQGEQWQAYEIHMGRSHIAPEASPLLHVLSAGKMRPEGARNNSNRVWGTYLHGLFESANLRREICRIAGLDGHRASTVSFRVQREALYNEMADLLESHLNLEDLWRYVEN